MLEIYKNKKKIYPEDYNEPKNKPFKHKILKDRIKTITLNKEYKNMIYYPSSKEWFTSVYTYNKSYIKSLIVYDPILNVLLKSYVNILKKTVHRFRRRRNKKIRYSANKLFISNAELKHTNNKLVVLVYLFNKKKLTIQSSLIKNIYNFFKNIRKTVNLNTTYFDKFILANKEPRGLYKSLFYDVRGFKFNSLYFNIPKKNIYFKRINSELTKLWKKNTLTSNSIPSIDSLKTKSLENIVLDTTINLNLNSVNFNSSRLNLENLGILKLLQKIYGKKVEFRVVDLKSVHLNSDIFS